VDDGDCPVGLIPGAEFHAIERHFPAGARLCILSDGISETENSVGEEFGTRLVGECLLGAEPINRVLSHLHSFSSGQDAQDDRTMVVLERTQ
jgi:sigma-B regulation protein RsbU (phosphoserine phosphatase)